MRGCCCVTLGKVVGLLVKLCDLNGNALIWYIAVLLKFFWECCSTLAPGLLHNSGRRWGINQTWATNTCSSFSVINRFFPATSGKDKFHGFSFAFSSPFFFSASVQFSLSTILFAIFFSFLLRPNIFWVNFPFFLPRIPDVNFDEPKIAVLWF